MKILVILALGALALAAQPLPEGRGLAARYPGDAGIERDPAVVFAENFEGATLADIVARWNSAKNREGKVLELASDTAPGSSGRQSLRMTATRGQNDGGDLYRLLMPGYDRLFLRFYTKFGAENGFNHHFVSLGGEIDPRPYPVGRAGLRPEDRWNSGIEPTGASRHTVPPTPYPPPGIWHFYTYWPEMRSWQNADGTGTSFYGNNFEPKTPFPVRRGEWTCVEIMIKMNSAPDRYDGEQAVWIDGKLAGHFGPGTIKGLWERDNFRIDEVNGKPFEGIRWRKDMRVTINKLWLSHYVSEDAFKRTDRYLAAHPDFKASNREVVVWFDDLVVSKEYVGPLQRR